jgi:hypothetical protein
MKYSCTSASFQGVNSIMTTPYFCKKAVSLPLLNLKLFLRLFFFPELHKLHWSEYVVMATRTSCHASLAAGVLINFCSTSVPTASSRLKRHHLNPCRVYMSGTTSEKRSRSLLEGHKKISLLEYDAVCSGRRYSEILLRLLQTTRRHNRVKRSLDSNRRDNGS